MVEGESGDRNPENRRRGERASTKTRWLVELDASRLKKRPPTAQEIVVEASRRELSRPPKKKKKKRRDPRRRKNDSDISAAKLKTGNWPSST